MMKYADSHVPIAAGPDRREVDLRIEPTPAEDPQSEERRFQEERHQALHRERSAEDVTDEA